MTALLALLLLIAAVAIGGRGFYVWNHCGYDCSAIPQLGLGATTCILLGMLLAALGVGLLLTVLLESEW
jgi:hypothetical protein